MLSLLAAMLLGLHRRAVELGIRLGRDRREVVLLSLHRQPAAMHDLPPPVILVRRLNSTSPLRGLACAASADFLTES